MTVHKRANDLCVYTIKICNNEKVFDPAYKTLTADIVETAKNIFMDAWMANDIRMDVKDPEQRMKNYKRRHELQRRSVWYCDRLLALMQIAQRVFHLKTKRIKFWGGMTREVKTMLRAWCEADSKRYGESRTAGIGM